MNERLAYSGAKGDLSKYIQLLSKERGALNADELDEVQKLGKKLQGQVIPESVYAGSNIPGEVGEIVDFTRIKTDSVLSSIENGKKQ